MNRQDTVSPGRREWTDRELDLALRQVQVIAQPPEPHLAAARAALFRAVDDELAPVKVGGGARRRWRRPVLLAAAVAALVTGGLIIPTLQWGGRPVNSAVAAEFNQAADAAAARAAAGGDVTPSGHYRYIDIVGWNESTHYSNGSPLYAFLEQGRQQIWVPADWRDTWMERRTTTGQRTWIHGSEKDAVAAGEPKDNVASTAPDLTGPCQQYFTNVCTAEGSWQTPTRAWIAGLPKSGDDMYDRLYDDSKGHGQSQEDEMLVQATDALQTGLLPASVQATLYRAMAQIGGVEISDTAVNLDGVVGTGFSVSSPALRDETIIDPKTGEFIGTRTITLTDDTEGHVPAGTVINYTAVHTETVKTLSATHP